MPPYRIQALDTAIIFARPENIEDLAPASASVVQDRTFVLVQYFPGIVACGSDHDAHVSAAIINAVSEMMLIALNRKQSPLLRVMNATNARRGPTGKGSPHVGGGQLDAMRSDPAPDTFWLITVGSSNADIEGFARMIDGQYVDPVTLVEIWRLSIWRADARSTDFGRRQGRCARWRRR